MSLNRFDFDYTDDRVTAERIAGAAEGRHAGFQILRNLNLLAVVHPFGGNDFPCESVNGA